MFSYAEYKNIIILVKQHLPIVDFLDVYITDVMPKFCVLRHDIEFSIDRALKMARIEHYDLGVHSTYTVQLRNNTYNALSQKNIEAIQEIKKLGHHIGLHQNPPKMNDSELYYLSRHMEAQRNIRTWMRVHERDFNSYLTDQMVGQNSQSLFSKTMGASKPFYHQLQSPAARKSLRLLQVVNETTMMKASERLSLLTLVTREADRSPFWQAYVRGSKQDLEKYGITGHQEFIHISKYMKIY